MELKDVLAKVDHTLLDPAATWNDIKAVCDDGIQYGVASVCIPPVFVKKAKEYVGDKLPICTVIGFPNGYATTAVKVFEAADAVKNGADEIDMVIHIGMVKQAKYAEVLAEINAVKEACGDKILKVIIETCLLTDEEKIEMCRVVSQSRADFIKTSTGFAGGGATKEDIALMAGYMSPDKKIKAAGGIASIEDAAVFLTIGADRLGTSRIVKILKNQETKEGY